MIKYTLPFLLLGALTVSCGAFSDNSSFNNDSDDSGSNDDRTISFTFNPGSPVCSCDPVKPFVGLKSLSLGTCDCSKKSLPQDDPSENTGFDASSDIGDNSEHPEDELDSGSNKDSNGSDSSDNNDSSSSFDGSVNNDGSSNDNPKDSGSVKDSGTNTSCNSFEFDCNNCYVFSYCTEYGYEEQIACKKELNTCPTGCTREESWDYSIGSQRYHVYICKK